MRLQRDVALADAFKHGELAAFTAAGLAYLCAAVLASLRGLKKLILSEKWYIRGNVWSLMDWDMGTVASVFNSLSDRGFVTGNEVRDHLNLTPREGLDVLRVLENYIPADMTGLQKKLIQED